MPRAKTKKGKATHAEQEPSTSTKTPEAVETDSEAEFQAVEESLQQSLSYDTLTWMKHVIKVQAENVLKIRLEKIAAQDAQTNTEKLTKQLSDLEKKLQDIDKEVNLLKAEKTKSDGLKQKVEELQRSNEMKTEQIAKLQQEIRLKDESIKKTILLLDNIQQKDYEKDVQLIGLSESANLDGDIMSIVNLAQEKMMQRIEVEYVEEVIRLGRKSSTKPRDLVVRFKDKKTRDIFYNNRKKTASSKNICENIYVNDRLTRYRKGLFFKARQLFKAKVITAAWTQNGNVLIRRDIDSPPQQILGYNDLEEHGNVNECPTGLDNKPGDTDSVETHISNYEFWPDLDDL